MDMAEIRHIASEVLEITDPKTRLVSLSDSEKYTCLSFKHPRRGMRIEVILALIESLDPLTVRITTMEDRLIVYFIKPKGSPAGDPKGDNES